MFIAALVIDFVNEQREKVDAAGRRAETLTHILGEHLRSTISSADAALQQIAVHSRQLGGVDAAPERWIPLLESLRVGLPGIGSLTITGPDGVIRHSTIRQAIGQSRRDNYVFGALRDSTRDELIASTPFRSIRGPGVLIPLGRRLTAADGSFAGVVVATLDLGLLRNIYRAVDTGPQGAIYLVHPNGTLLLRESASDPQASRTDVDPVLLQLLSNGRASSVIEGALRQGGRHRITAFRIIDQPRILLGVSLAREDILADFHRQALIRAIVIMLVGAALLVAGRGLMREASTRAASERAIAVHEQQLTDAQRIAGMASLRFIGAGPVARLSDQAREFFSFASGQASVTGGALAEVFAEPDAVSLREAMRVCIANGTAFDMELRVGDPQKPSRLLRVEGKQEVGRFGNTPGVLVVLHDVTQQRRTEERLRHAERLEAVGRLTGGVAHDFNNMLTVILGNVDRLSDAPIPDPTTVHSAAEEIGRAAERASELTQQLLAFARRQPLRPRRVDIGELVRTATGVLGRVLGEQIKLRVDAAREPCICIVDTGQLEIALVNLCANARDAMPGGGLLVVTIGRRELDEEYARQQPDVTAGPYVMLSVSDTGVGIAADQLAHIFEPFFTTKEPGKGTGLGLAMVYGFVKQSGGHIRVYSEARHGTTIRIYLPDAGDAPAEAVPAGTDDIPRGRGETILVVEDEEMVRDAVSRQLVGLGYDVLAVGDSEGALAAMQGNAGIAMLLTDVVLASGLNGRSLATRIRAVRPGLPVLFMSGYAESVVAHHGQLQEGIQLLSKPYHRRELAQMVRRALDGAPGSAGVPPAS